MITEETAKTLLLQAYLSREERSYEELSHPVPAKDVASFLSFLSKKINQIFENKIKVYDFFCDLF